jgi:hypothetical protein
MRTSFSAIVLVVAAATGAAVVVSCAASEPEPEPPAPTADGGDAAEASVDAGADADPDAHRAACDAGDSTCTSELLPCSATDFCPVAVAPLGESYRQYAVNAVWGSSASSVDIVGAAGTIVHWDGTSLTLAPPLTTYTLNAIWGAGPDDVWVASTPDVILHRTAAGWSKAPPAETNLFRIHAVMLRAAWGPLDGSAVFLGGDRLTKVDGDDPETQLWNSPTTDIAWSSASEIPFFTVQSIWGSSVSDYWVVGYVFQTGVVAYHVVTSSEPKSSPTWISTDLQTSATMNAVWGSGPNDVWTVGQGGAIRHHTGDPSVRWDVVASPTNQDLHAVWGSGPNDAWAAGNGGTLLHWNGTTWRRLVASFPVGANPDLYGLWGSGPNDVWAVGASGTILRSAGVKTAEEGHQP